MAVSDPTLVDVSGELSEEEAATGGETAGETASGDEASSGGEASTSGDGGDTPAEDPASPEEDGAGDDEESEWMFEGSTLDTRRIAIPGYVKKELPKFTGTSLDSRAIALERTLTERALKDTSLDARAVRVSEGTAIGAEEQRFAGTTLDARAVRRNTQSALSAGNLVQRFDASLFLDPIPPTTGRFFVLLGPVPDMAFQECSGIGFSREAESFAEGGAGWNRQFPGNIQYDNIVLRRGLVIGPGWIQLRRWRESMLSEDPPLRMNGVIVLQSDLGVPICIWRFKNGWPVRWNGPSLSPGDAQLAIEELEIAHEGLKVMDHALGLDVVSAAASGFGASLASELGGAEGLNQGMSAAQGIMSGDIASSIAGLAGI